MSSNSTSPSSLLATASSSDMSISLGLARITRLLQSLGSPHLSMPIVHIAGTNGKGSVSAYLSSILSKSKLRVARFNSPHLVDEWDCIRMGDKEVEERQFRAVKSEVERANEEGSLGATSFEVLTATAFALFARSSPPLDIAVVEVGMGGVGDATNVVPAGKTLLSILTSVELDHQAFLGDTVEQITKVKAGIVREAGDLVVSEQKHNGVLEAAKEVAAEKGARLWQAGAAEPPTDKELNSTATQQSLPAPQSVALPLSPTTVYPCSTVSSPSPPTISARLPLPGSYQLANASTAVLAAHLLRTLPRTLALQPKLAGISDMSIREGVEATRWPGRLQWLNLPSSSSSSAPQPLSEPAPSRRILLDGAHNPSSAALLASYLSSLPRALRPSTLIFGLSAPRAPDSVLTPLIAAETGISKVICVGFSPPVGMPWVKPTSPELLTEAARELDVETVEQARDVEDAFGKAGVGEDVVVAGSLYLVADALRLARRIGGTGAERGSS
ncbi:SPOSA6832_00889 [Sporobolomyces salmonicolor]|uniref:SPOSA6832_00889-mRNA-1:cds n=1 Tax=Sporidiobolus salmonicolor TaxID=5005 RepID=A0A0D6EHW9_SPOSA|nr:SPOSA6832_00889 [Sporobolomyces salmonicolor]